VSIKRSGIVRLSSELAHGERVCVDRFLLEGRPWSESAGSTFPAATESVSSQERLPGVWVSPRPTKADAHKDAPR